MVESTNSCVAAGFTMALGGLGNVFELRASRALHTPLMGYIFSLLCITLHPDCAVPCRLQTLSFSPQWKGALEKCETSVSGARLALPRKSSGSTW